MFQFTVSYYSWVSDISLNPDPLYDDQLQLQSEWSILIRGGFILSTSTLKLCYLKSMNLEILPNYLMQQL